MRRLIVLALVTCALAGCGRRADEAFLDSRVPPSLGPRFYPPDGWAWGVLHEPDTPDIRYGVASPPVAPRAHVVLLPGYGESAEVYFETARDLLDRGYTVWVLEAAGQGGSGRFWGGRDLGRSNGFGVDAQALGDLVRKVIRPAPRQPVVVAATGSAALSALLAAEDGQPFDALVVWSPAEGSPQAGEAESRARWGMGAFRADGAAEWKRPDRDLSGRDSLPLAWQTANPDLRMGGPSWGWLRDEARAFRIAYDPARLRAVKQPVLLFESAGKNGGFRPCPSLARCTVEPLASEPVPAHLAGDSVRSVWLQRLTGFVEDRIAERDHAA